MGTTSNATKVLAALFIAAIPLFLITAGVTWAVNDLRLYSHGFDKYNIPAATGIEREGLIQVGRDLRAYFNSGQEPLEVRAEVFGQERRLFSAREVLHMRDVKRLVWGVYILGAIAAVYLLGVTAVGLMWKGGRFGPLLSRWVLWGGAATIGLIAVVGLTALVAFDQLFLAFHKVSFANDFWRLDASRDYLVIMFPDGFWFDATLFVAFVAIGGALLLSAAAGGYLLVRRHRIRREIGSVLPQQEKVLRV